MNIQELATHYLKYWNQDPDGNWQLADNAPSVFWRLIYSMPRYYDRNMVHASLKGLATKDAPPDPTKEQVLKWLQTYPTAFKRCDDALNAKGQKITSTNSLLKKAYNNEMFGITDVIHQFLLNQINKQG